MYIVYDIRAYKSYAIIINKLIIIIHSVYIYIYRIDIFYFSYFEIINYLQYYVSNKYMKYF